MLAVLRFDRSVYLEVEYDPAGTRQAARVVVLVAVVAGVGTVLLTGWHFGAILGAVLAAQFHWLLWSVLDFLAGRLLFRTRAPFQRQLRALGFAQTPLLLSFFAFVPMAGPWIVGGSRIMTMLAGNLALATVLEIRRRQAFMLRAVSIVTALSAAAGVRALLGDVAFLTALFRP